MTDVTNARSILEKGTINTAGRSRRQNHKRQEQAITWMDALETGSYEEEIPILF